MPRKSWSTAGEAETGGVADYQCTTVTVLPRAILATAGELDLRAPVASARRASFPAGYSSKARAELIKRAMIPMP